MDRLEVFQRHRGRMFGIAYRMLGSATEADEVLQDAWLRWQSVDQTVKEPAAFLAKTVTNLCLSQLTSARARRETYVGEWLPEPILTSPFRENQGPLDHVAQQESVSYALLLVLEKLTPAERAAYVLREAFAYTHREVGDLIGTTEANARQLHSRARKHVVAADKRSDRVDPGKWRLLVERFLAAAQHGDIAGLEKLLTADVISRADGGGKANAARKPVLGRERVARYLIGSLTKFGAGILPYLGEANGEPAIIAADPDNVRAVIFVRFDGDQIAGLEIVMNPDKLSRIDRLRGPDW